MREMKKFIKKFIKVFFYLLIFILLVKFSSNYLLGYFLRNIFSDGTKCVATLKHPVVHFFPLAASVENVSIVSPEEKKYGGGFRADRISIAVNTSALFRKELRLENLKLEGANAYSLGKDTGLINTLAFLFPPKKKSRENLEGSPFLKWISTWGFHVTDIHIYSDPEKKSQLILGVPDNYVSWDDLKIDFIEQDFDIKKPYDFVASSSNFFYTPASSAKIKLGDFSTRGIIGLGKVYFGDNTLGKALGAETTATGEIILGEEGFYNLDFSARAKQDYITRAFEESVLKSINPVDLKAEGRIEGKLNNPQVKLLVQAGFKEGGIYYLKAGTEPKQIKADVLVNLDRVAVENVFLTEDSKKDIDLQAAFSYFFAAKEFLLETLKLNSYRADKFAALLSAVLSEEENKRINTYLLPESKVNLDLKGKFNADRISLEGKAEIDNIALLNAPLDKLKIQFLMPTENLLQANLEANLLNGKVLGKFNLLEGEEIKGEAKFSGLELAKIKEFSQIFPNLSNQIDATLLLSGKLQNPAYEITGNVVSSKILGKNLDQKRSDFKISGNLEKLIANAQFFDRTLNLNIICPLADTTKNDFELELLSTSLPLGYLFSKEQLGNAEGELAGSFHYHSKADDLYSGDGKIEINRFSYLKDQFRIIQSDKILILLNKGDLDFSQVKFKVQEKEITLKGGLNLHQGWHATLTGNWELGTLSSKQDFFEQLSGDLSLELQISGDLLDPKFSGPLKLAKFSFALPLGNNIVGLTDGVVLAELTAGDLSISEISARMNGAILKGQGRIEDIFSEARKVNLLLNFPNVVIEPVDNLNLELDGNLRLFKDANQPWVISGEVAVQNALYEKIISLLTIIKSITDFLTGNSYPVTIKKENRQYLEDFILDLRLKAEKGLVLETNIAQAELRGDLKVTGNLARPLFSGKVEVIEGIFGLQSKEFDIINGQLLFVPGNTDPQISLLSETVVLNQAAEDEHITLGISGTLKYPEVSLHSESGLRQEDIQGLLGIGTSFDAVRRNEKLGKHYGLADLINPASEVSLADRFSSLTNLSSIQFGTALSPLTGEFIPIVSAKKPLIDKFELHLQSELSRQQAGSVTIDYVLNSNLKFFGGLETLPEGRAKSESSGGFAIGVNYQSSFSGYNIFPSEVSNFFYSTAKPNSPGSAEPARPELAEGPGSTTKPKGGGEDKDLSTSSGFFALPAEKANIDLDPSTPVSSPNSELDPATQKEQSVK